MSEEEIMQAAKELVRELVRQCDYAPEDDETAAKVIRSAASRARREALEEAARIVELDDYPIVDPPSVGTVLKEKAATVRSLNDESAAAAVRAVEGEG